MTSARQWSLSARLAVENQPKYHSGVSTMSMRQRIWAQERHRDDLFPSFTLKLDGFVMENVDSKNSLDSELHFGYLCSIRILTNLKVIHPQKGRSML